MKKTETLLLETQKKTSKDSLVSLFDTLLSSLSIAVEELPQTLRDVSPEKRLEFISKTLPLLLRFRETGEWGGFEFDWGI